MKIEMARLGSALRLDRAWKSAGPHALRRPFSADWARAVCAYARTPSRATWTWARSPAQRLEPLVEDLVSALQDRDLPQDLPTSVEVHDVGPVQAGPLQVRGAVMSALSQALGAVLEPHHPKLVVTVRGDADGLLIGEDLAGSLTHRGYRRPQQEAPLREHLAAQMVALSSWRPSEEPLVDPMCGSGTILAEAHGWAHGVPVTRSGRWTSAQPAFLRPEPPPRLVGLEPSARAVRDARATLSGRADIRHGRIEELIEDLGPQGVAVVNPPYGVRLGDEDEARESLIALRDWFDARPAGWRLVILAPAALVREVFARESTMTKAMPNGPLRTTLFRFERT